MTAAIECPTFKPSLKLGNKGQDVKELQKRLNQRLATISTYPVAVDVDGDFGADTETAVRYLQSLAFLPVTKISDAATWNFICNGATSLPVLKQNSSGATVKAVQQTLNYAGFYSGAIDGIFGARMVQAVKDFQKFYSLTTDGVIGAATWNILIKLDAHLDNCYSMYYAAC